MRGWRYIVVLAAMLFWGNTPSNTQEEPYRIYFSSDRDTGANWQLYSMASDGGEIQRVTTSDTYDYGAVISPDGTQVAYTRRTPDGYTEVHLANLATPGQSRLLVAGGDPTWSPDGEQIAYTRTEANNTDIYIIDADGFNDTQLTTHPAKDYAPSWSPDGAFIAFKSQREADLGAGVYIVAPDRTNLQRITDSDGSHYPPAWSPDNLLLTFTREIDDLPAIHTVRVADSVSRRLSDSGTVDIAPRFSADGDRIVFASVVSNQPDIYEMDLAGVRRTPLTNSPAWDWLPTIGP